jgi:hypothetical protein
MIANLPTPKVGDSQAAAAGMSMSLVTHVKMRA